MSAAAAHVHATTAGGGHARDLDAAGASARTDERVSGPMPLPCAVPGARATTQAP